MFTFDFPHNNLHCSKQDEISVSQHGYGALYVYEGLCDDSFLKFPSPHEIVDLECPFSSDTNVGADESVTDELNISRLTPQSLPAAELLEEIRGKNELQKDKMHTFKFDWQIGNSPFSSGISQSPILRYDDLTNCASDNLVDQNQEFEHSYGNYRDMTTPLTPIDFVADNECRIHNWNWLDESLSPTSMLNMRSKSIDSAMVQLEHSEVLKQDDKEAKSLEFIDPDLTDLNATTYSTNYVTSFVNSNNAMIYQNTVLDGLLTRENNDIYDPSKFKDNINLKLKLGADYDRIIKRFAKTGSVEVDPKESLPGDYRKPKRKNKIFEQRRTGRAPTMNIKESIELATRAIEKSHLQSKITKPEPKTKVFPLLKNKILEHNFTEEDVQAIKIEKKDSFCCKCKSNISDYWQYIDHWDSHRPKLSRNYQCVVPKCPMSVIGFLQKSGLVHHTYDCHFRRGQIMEQFLEWEEELRMLLYTCKYKQCNKAFYRRDSLTRHERLLHTT